MALSTSPQVDLHTAGFTRRAMAGILDTVPALTLWGAVSMTMASTNTGGAPPSQWNALDRAVDTLNTEPALIIWPLIWLGAALIAWHFLTVAIFGTSPGKRVVGLRLFDGRGEQLGPFRALAHACMRPITSACLAIGPLWALADPERRTLYDRLSGVYVGSMDISTQRGNRRR